MIFIFNYIPDRIADISEVVFNFLSNSVDNNTFSENLFPDWFKPVVGELDSTSDAFRDLHVALHNSTKDERQKMKDIYSNNNKIEKMCSDVSFAVSDLNEITSEDIRSAFIKLMETLWEETITRKAYENAVQSSLRRYYLAFRKTNSLKVCPFCGIYRLPSEGEDYRSHYDHHLPKALYPASSVNFHNLVPMCNYCNSGVKKTKDPLKDSDNRVIAYYPYRVHSGIIIVIDCIEEGTFESGGQWRVKISASKKRDEPYVESWLKILNIENRFSAVITDKAKVWGRKTAVTKTLKNYYKHLCDDDGYTKDVEAGFIEVAYINFLAKKASSTVKKSFVEIAKTRFSEKMRQRGDFLN